MEIAAIIISVIALLLSAASFYFQFFYKRDVIICTLVGFNGDTRQVAVQLAIGNAGTRPIMLKDARLRLEFKLKNGGTIFHDDINQRNILEPVLIPKDEIKSVTLITQINEAAKQCITSWHESGDVVDSDGAWPFRARLIFVAVSGKIIISEELVLTVRWMKDGSAFLPREERTWRIG
jgi:hypothetical protein